MDTIKHWSPHQGEDSVQLAQEVEHRSAIILSHCVNAPSACLLARPCLRFKLINPNWKSSKPSLLMSQQTAEQTATPPHPVQTSRQEQLNSSSSGLGVCVYSGTLWSSGSIVACMSQKTISGYETMGITTLHLGTEIYSLTPQRFHRQNFPHAVQSHVHTFPVWLKCQN